MADTSVLSSITSKTMVPISLVVSLLGGGGWLTKVHSTVEKNAVAISEIKQELKEKEEDKTRLLREINTRLSRIEGKLGVTTSQ